MSLKLFHSTGFSSVDGARHGRAALHPSWMVLLASVWLATVANAALWRELWRLSDVSGVSGAAFAAGFAVIIAGAIGAILSVFNWRWTLKPVITLFLFSAAFGAYFMLSYGVVIDATMMANVLATDARETRDLLNWRLFACVLVLAVAPAWWLWRTPLRRVRPARRLLANAGTLLLAVAAFAAALLLSFQAFSSTMRNHTQVRYLVNPLNSFYALGWLAAKPFGRDDSVLLPLGEDARPGASYAAPGKPPMLLMVLGETARSGNFAINGYARPTTPELAAQNVASFRNAWSCGTNTAASVPCMFSNLGRGGYENRKANYENLLDVLQRAGLAVLWIDNQSGCKGVCDRVPSADTTQLKVPNLCADGECFDEIMLEGLDQRIAALPAERRANGVVVVMHQMGGHGPAYYKRTPAAYKKFMPECASNALQECSRELVTNAYDNTVVYTDHFVASAIRWLQARDADVSGAMLYVADHGESLGENNIYLHGLPYAIAPDVQKRVPWVSWLSPAFERKRGIATDCLKRRLDAEISHDNYFHSVLGLMDVQTAVYKPALDIFKPCAGVRP